VINALIRRHWDRAMRPVGRAVAGSGISPDAVTALGVALQVVAAYFIIEGRLGFAGLFSATGALMDVLDGAVARARGLTNKFGALLDSTTDRIADALVFIPIAWLYGVSPDFPRRDQAWVAAVALTALVASFLVSYVKARAEGLGYECNVGFAERAERMILMIVALLFDFVPVAVSLVAVAAVITFVQRLLHVKKQALRVER